MGREGCGTQEFDGRAQWGWSFGTLREALYSLYWDSGEGHGPLRVRTLKAVWTRRSSDHRGGGDRQRAHSLAGSLPTTVVLGAPGALRGLGEAGARSAEGGWGRPAAAGPMLGSQQDVSPPLPLPHLSNFPPL